MPAVSILDGPNNGSGIDETIDITMTVSSSATALLVGIGCGPEAGGTGSATWDPSGANESLTLRVHHSNASGRAMIRELVSPTPGNSKTLRVSGLAAIAVVSAITIIDHDEKIAYETDTVSTIDLSVTSELDFVFLVGAGRSDTGSWSGTPTPTNIAQVQRNEVGWENQGMTTAWAQGPDTYSWTYSATDQRSGGAAYAHRITPGNQLLVAMSEAWDSWRDRTGLLVPKGFNEPILIPEPI